MTCHWCGKELTGKRSHARFCDSSCRANASRWRQGRPGEEGKALGSAAPPPIDQIRREQEVSKERWTTLVASAIAKHFQRDRSAIFHADDLDYLLLPDEHRNVIGSQIAKCVNRGYIVECGRRKSANPRRNGAKSNEYRLTQAGVKWISGVERDGLGDTSATLHSGDRGGAGVGKSQDPQGASPPQLPGLEEESPAARNMRDAA